MKKRTMTRLRFLFLMTMALCLSAFVKTEVLAEGFSIKGNYVGNGTTDESGTDWSYKAATKTLTLNNFTYNGNKCAIEASEMADLNIVLVGNNTITVTTGSEGATGIDAQLANDGKLTISGNGKLTVSTAENVAIACTQALEITGCTITATSGYGNAIDASWGLSINGATVTATAGNTAGGLYSCGLYSGENCLSIKDSTITASGAKGRYSCGIRASHSDIVIDHSVVKATAVSEADDNSIGIMVSSSEAPKGLIIKNGSVVTASSDGTDNDSYGIYSEKGIIIDTDVKSVTATCGHVAIYCLDSFTNEIEGTGWKDTAGTQDATIVPVRLQGIDQSGLSQQDFLESLKKICFPKAALPIAKAPKARDLTWTGAAQKLVEAGTVTGGTMEYVLGTDAALAPATGFSDEIPTGTEEGTYYVWYRSVGTGVYGVSAPECVTVIIKPATVNVSFDANGGTGTMNKVSVEKGSSYTLPACTFTPPKGKAFDKWDQGAAGASIKVTADTTLKAIWKDTQTAPDENIDPRQKSTTVSKVKPGKKSVTVTWKKQQAKGIKGYQIQYSTDKKFKKDIKTVTITKTKTTSKKIKKLKSGKKYYIRIRTFKKSGSKKVYSKWSKVKNTKVL